jgi:hypothetical protein
MPNVATYVSRGAENPVAMIFEYECASAAMSSKRCERGGRVGRAWKPCGRPIAELLSETTQGTIDRGSHSKGNMDSAANHPAPDHASTHLRGHWWRCAWFQACAGG